MELTEKQIHDLNNMNKASQNIKLGDTIDGLIKNGGGGGGGTSSGDMKSSQYATNPKAKDGFVDKAIYAESALNATNAEKANSAIKVDSAELSDGTKLLTQTQADNDYVSLTGDTMNGILTIDRTNITDQSVNVDTIKSKVYLDATSKGRHHDLVDIDIGNTINVEKIKYATESDSNPEISSTTLDGNILLMENSSSDTELYLMNSRLNINSPSNKTETKLNERYLRLGRKVGDTTSDKKFVRINGDRAEILVNDSDSNSELRLIANGIKVQNDISDSSSQPIKITNVADGTENNDVVNLGQLNTAINNIPAYTLPTASSSQLGGVKVGNNLQIDDGGVLSAGPMITSGYMGSDYKTTINGDITVENFHYGNKSIINGGYKSQTSNVGSGTGIGKIVELTSYDIDMGGIPTLRFTNVSNDLETSSATISFNNGNMDFTTQKRNDDGTSSIGNMYVVADTIELINNDGTLISGVRTPVNATDAVNKKYVEDRCSQAMTLSGMGETNSGHIFLYPTGGFPFSDTKTDDTTITLYNGTSGTAYGGILELKTNDTGSSITSRKRETTETLPLDIEASYVSLSYGQLKDIAPPTDVFDAANKKYVDDSISNISTYNLPAATTTRLGGIKVGSNLSITADGTLSATTVSTDGFVKKSGDTMTGALEIDYGFKTTIGTSILIEEESLGSQMLIRMVENAGPVGEITVGKPLGPGQYSSLSLTADQVDILPYMQNNPPKLVLKNSTYSSLISVTEQEGLMFKANSKNFAASDRPISLIGSKVNISDGVDNIIISGVNNPVADNDAANKDYVDSMVIGAVPFSANDNSPWNPTSSSGITINNSLPLNLRAFGGAIEIYANLTVTIAASSGSVGRQLSYNFNTDTAIRNYFKLMYNTYKITQFNGYSIAHFLPSNYTTIAWANTNYNPTSDSVLVTFGLNLENNPSISSNSWVTFFHLYPHAIE